MPRKGSKRRKMAVKEETPAACYINNLPLETLSIILSTFTLMKKLETLRFVCKYWNTCILSDMRSLTSLDFGPSNYQDKFHLFGPDSVDSNGSGMCAHSFNESKSMVQFWHHRLMDEKRLKGLLALILNGCPNLRAIKLGSDWIPLMQSVLAAYGQQLECFYCPSFELDEPNLKLLKPSSTLRHLAVKCMRLNNFFGLFPNVTRLICNDFETSIVDKLPAGFESLAVMNGPVFQYLNAVSESPARSSIKEITVQGLVIQGTLCKVTFDSLQSLAIEKYSASDLCFILRVLPRSPLLKSVHLPQKNESKHHQNTDWINLFRSARLIETLDVSVNEISDEVFEVIASNLTHIKNLKMILTGDRIAATDAAFRSLSTIVGLQSIDLFFEQNQETVSNEVMVGFCTGASAGTLEMIRIDRNIEDDDDDYREKFDEFAGEMMEMVSDYGLGIGEIFGSHID